MWYVASVPHEASSAILLYHQHWRDLWEVEMLVLLPSLFSSCHASLMPLSHCRHQLSLWSTEDWECPVPQCYLDGQWGWHSTFGHCQPLPAPWNLVPFSFLRDSPVSLYAGEDGCRSTASRQLGQVVNAEQVESGQERGDAGWENCSLVGICRAA